MKMKKFFALILCAVLLLCAAGCNKEPAQDSLPTHEAPEVAGVLFVSIGAEYKVIYDAEGMVMALDSMTSTAADIVINYSDAAGATCGAVVSELVKQTIEDGKHPLNRVVVIKQAPESKTPTEAFLEYIKTSAIAVTDYEVVLIPADALTAEGYITADAAKDILSRQLKLTDVAMECSAPEDGVYTLTFELEGAEQEYEVDAVTGTVLLSSLPSDLMGDDGFDMYDDYEQDPDLIIDDPASDPANDNILDAPQTYE